MFLEKRSTSGSWTGEEQKSLSKCMSLASILQFLEVRSSIFKKKKNNSVHHVFCFQGNGGHNI